MQPSGRADRPTPPETATIVPFGLDFHVTCTLACAIRGKLTESQPDAMGDFFSGVLE